MDKQDSFTDVDEVECRKPVTFYIEPSVYAEIKNVARKIGTNTASALRMAARDFIEKNK